MNPYKSLVLIFLFSLIVALPTYAQETQEETPIFRIKTKDGNEFIGEIRLEDDQKIILLTEKLGEITIRKIDILSREEVNISRIVDGELWFENPQNTRYFFNPNGYGIRKGEAYYQNVWVLFNQVTVGVTDNFSLSAGMIPLFLFSGTPTPVWINPKVSIPVIENQYNVGAGALIGTVIGEPNTGFGILYAVNTFGDKDRNINLGLGWGYSSEGIASRPTVSIGGMYRTGPRGYILTENYIISTGNETVGLLSFGGRRIIGVVGLDYGLLIPFSNNEIDFIALPWLGITVPFGRKTFN